MTEPVTVKSGIVEAAAEVLAASIQKAGSETFGLGKGQNPAGIWKGPTDLGGTHYKGDQPFVDYTKGVPTATPPGQTPPVGAEAMKTLEKDRGEEHATLAKTLGFGGKVGPSNIQNGEGGVDPNMTSIADRKTNVKAYVAPGEGNKSMPWAKNESFQAKVAAILASTNESLSEDVDAVFNGENLSDEFKTKASTIFEAAVSTKVQAIAEALEEAAVEELNEAVAQIQEELTTQVDEYLNYMVTEWVKDNEIAIEKGLKAEIVEDFISGLRTLFIEHYIDIPEDKVDLVADLQEQIDALQEQLNTEITKNVELNGALGESKKSDILNAVCEGLVQTQAEKIKTLAESVEYSTADEYKAKLLTLRENYFPKTVVKESQSKTLLSEFVTINDKNVIVEDDQSNQGVRPADPLMGSIFDAISRTKKS